MSDILNFTLLDDGYFCFSIFLSFVLNTQLWHLEIIWSFSVSPFDIFYKTKEMLRIGSIIPPYWSKILLHTLPSILWLRRFSSLTGEKRWYTCSSMSVGLFGSFPASGGRISSMVCADKYRSEYLIKTLFVAFFPSLSSCFLHYSGNFHQHSPFL